VLDIDDQSGPQSASTFNETYRSSPADTGIDARADIYPRGFLARALPASAGYTAVADVECAGPDQVGSIAHIRQPPMRADLSSTRLSAGATVDASLTAVTIPG